MRRCLPVILVLVIVLSLVVLVSANSVNSAKISSPVAVVEPVDDASSGNQHRYEKTVIIYYTDFDEVPDCVEFSEYSQVFDGEFSGILSVQKVTRVANMKYEAVFTGDLMGTV